MPHHRGRVLAVRHPVSRGLLGLEKGQLSFLLTPHFSSTLPNSPRTLHTPVQVSILNTDLTMATGIALIGSGIFAKEEHLVCLLFPIFYPSFLGSPQLTGKDQMGKHN